MPIIWGSVQVGLLSVSPAGGRAQFLKCMYNSTFLILSLFLCQTFGRVIKLDCYLWALLSPEGGRAQFLKCVYNSKFLILSWFLCQTFGGVFKFDCCLWAKRTIAKMCEHSNILNFILIFVPNSWGSYQVRLLSLGPEGGLDCTNSKKNVCTLQHFLF